MSTIWVVSGMIRSGTSMVMAALRAGGMSIYWDQQHEADLRASQPAARNPGGYWEPSPEEREEMGFPLQAVGKAIKILAPWMNLGKMMPADYVEYKILIIRRNPRDIGASIEKLLGESLSAGDKEALANYDERIAKACAIAWSRKDVRSVDLLDFEDILERPQECFQQIKQDWPINVKRATAVINPSLRTCQHREQKIYGPEDAGKVVLA